MDHIGGSNDYFSSLGFAIVAIFDTGWIVSDLDLSNERLRQRTRSGFPNDRRF